VWKVDWPMRWAYENVVFEPSGVDHSSPGSSFVVGGQIVTAVFGAEQPIGPMYAFVGISGMAKMSSSAGGVPTAADALTIMEAPLLRWLYVRRRPNQSFTVAFDQEILRLYDEWDALTRKVTDGKAPAVDVAVYDRATSTATAGRLPLTARALPYRTLASIVDVSAGHDEQTLRILRDLDPSDPVSTLDEVRPRLDRAQRWVLTQVPAEERTIVRSEPDTALLASLEPPQRESLRLLLKRPRRPLVAGGTDLAGVRRAEDPARAAAGRQADRGAEGRAAHVLRAPLPPAGRTRHRPALLPPCCWRSARTGSAPSSAPDSVPARSP
jgi:lysyl-tRNA synthetase class 1